MRGKRSAWMEDKHGGIDFPSAESALLTISFLTFAVFLIKLVLVSEKCQAAPLFEVLMKCVVLLTASCDND